MKPLWAGIVKEGKVLIRDRMGLLLMFVMPILLVVVITSVQNSSFELINDNRMPLLVCNADTGQAGAQLLEALHKVGMFEVLIAAGPCEAGRLRKEMQRQDALAMLLIPPHFSLQLSQKAEFITTRALEELGLGESRATLPQVDSLQLYVHPVLQASFRQSIQGSLRAALQLVENRQLLTALYQSLNDTPPPSELEQALLYNQIGIASRSLSGDGSRSLPNATQHNIPAWTIFAMFFMVLSMGTNMVKEKESGSYLRLKTLPTSFYWLLWSKQLTYLGVALLQLAVIFSLGVWLFPHLGLPPLHMPRLGGLLLVSLLCGACAVSYALCVGMYARSQQQANGFGAVSVVILAAIGGIMVPGFAMPATLQLLMKFSPLHWALEAYYGLFLKGGGLWEEWENLLALAAMSAALQLLALLRMRKERLV
ncbi:MAG: ABC transporter permease [Bacteroidetes bacterium]|nr:MAG: ABC transporter permease [Bacteroidota bacterium]